MIHRSVPAVLAAVALPVVLLSAWSGPAVADGTGAPAYRITELPSLGGSISTATGVNDRGWITGSSTLAGDRITHAALWRSGRVTDLGALGGDNSAAVFSSHSNRFVVGVAETAAVNPDGEDWSCSVFFAAAASHHDCVGFVWQDGRMRPLPTLGGHNGFAAGSNRRGDIVGWAENGRLDPTCSGTQIRQFRAVRWDARTHRAHELPPLPGDSTSAATAINDRGDAVGISGACGFAVGGVSAAHAVRWDADGTPHDLGRIGGVQWNTPVAINERGLITGFANVPGGATPASFYPNAFAWSPRSGIRTLGTLPGDVLSEGLGLNDHGQIVGESCQAHLANCRAVLIEDGRMTALRPQAGTPLTLLDADDINDQGTIAGTARHGASTVAYAAEPVGPR